ncbi:MAG: hypothetical protein E7173_03900 [Firmicutes bacterium]|nr:hypothetical protein [Bacillota bacterium]
MKQVMIKNAEGKLINVDVIRYFRMNSIEYLIFSLNEVDDGGYAKLYVSKIVDGVGQTIEDDVEWNLIKDTIKNIIKSNKDNAPLSITDLNVNGVNNLLVIDRKIFKLNDSLLQLLMANISEPTTFEVPVTPAEENNVIDSLPNTEFNVFQNGINGVSNDAFNAPATVETETNEIQNGNSIENSSGYTLDYKSLYENELRKTDELTREIERYKGRLNDIKTLIDHAI